MNVLTRGVRNAFRNWVRTLSIVIILGLSIGLALSMLIARQAVDQKITSVKSSVGNTISVSPAGVQGFEGGGNPLTLDQVNSLKSVANVTAVTATLSDRLTSSNTSLQSAVDAGSLGQRNSSTNGVTFQAPPARNGESTSSGERSFTPPVRVTGVNDVSQASIYGGSSVTFTSGAAFDPTKDVNEAVVGKELATKNNLSVGSTFTAYNTAITVVGIYDTGTTFANNTVVMPLAALQRLSGQTGSVTSATVTVNSIDNLDSTTTAIKTKLGTAADVTNAQQSATTAVAPLESVKTIAVYSLIAALVAGAVIILLTMVMIVRERRREIGVMKAIGASNLTTMLQFIAESITLTFMGLIVGLGAALVVAAPMTNALVQSSESSAQSQQQPGASGGRGAFRGLRSAAVSSIQTVQTSASWSTLGYGVLVAFIIAILGSAVPAYAISRVRPSEVMRAE